MNLKYRTAHIQSGIFISVIQICHFTLLLRFRFLCFNGLCFIRHHGRCLRFIHGLRWLFCLSFRIICFCGQILDALIKSGRWRAVHNIYGITVARFQIILIRDLILAANVDRR